MLTVPDMKKATVKIYAVEFCKTNLVAGRGKSIYSSKDNIDIEYDGTFLIREDEIEKYRSYGGGINKLTLVGIMMDEEPICRCKCHEQETVRVTSEEDVFYDENEEDHNAFILKFIPEEGGESDAVISYHPSMYSLVGTVVQLQENSEIGLNGSKVYNKFEFRQGGDTQFMTITYEQARQIKEELEE